MQTKGTVLHFSMQCFIKAGNALAVLESLALDHLYKALDVVNNTTCL
jgi:hypothetical protein